MNFIDCHFFIRHAPFDESNCSLFYWIVSLSILIEVDGFNEAMT